MTSASLNASADRAAAGSASTRGVASAIASNPRSMAALLTVVGTRPGPESCVPLGGLGSFEVPSGEAARDGFTGLILLPIQSWAGPEGNLSQARLWACEVIGYHGIPSTRNMLP